MSTDTTVHPAIEALKAELALIEEKVVTGFTLADAIRLGSTVTDKQENGWVEGMNACALGAAYIAAQAHGRI